MKVNIKKLNKDAKIPAYGSEFAAAAEQSADARREFVERERF